MTDENDTKQNVRAKEQEENIRWNIIQLIYDTNKQTDIFEYADQIYQYVMNGKTDSS